MVYVDAIREYPEIAIKEPARRFGRRWSHMTSDTPEELHAMADKLGLKRSWFQPHRRPGFQHYDLTPSKRARALALGAVEGQAATE
jgi:hypothetical protein